VSRPRHSYPVQDSEVPRWFVSVADRALDGRPSIPGGRLPIVSDWPGMGRGRTISGDLRFGPARMER
jgi:hypothetical protein